MISGLSFVVRVLGCQIAKTRAVVMSASEFIRIFATELALAARI